MTRFFKLSGKGAESALKLFFRSVKFGGEGMYGLFVHTAVLEAGETESGATVHFVNEEYDKGKILLQRTVPVLPGDTPETLAARVLECEHQLYPDALEKLLAEQQS